MDTEDLAIAELEQITAEETPAEDTASREFVRPADTILGLKLRPYGAGTEIQLEQMRVVLKEKLKSLLAETPNEDARNSLSATYATAMFLYIHSAPLAEVMESVWSPKLFMERLQKFMQRFSIKDILSAMPAVAEIIRTARKADNYTIEPNGEPPHPN